MTPNPKRLTFLEAMVAVSQGKKVMTAGMHYFKGANGRLMCRDARAASYESAVHSHSDSGCEYELVERRKVSGADAVRALLDGKTLFTTSPCGGEYETRKLEGTRVRRGSTKFDQTFSLDDIMGCRFPYEVEG